LEGRLSKKQEEEEYIVDASCCTQVLWMRQTLEYLQIRYDDPLTINCDNTSVISISKNTIIHSKTKHIPIKYQFLRDRVTQRVVKVVYVETKEQIVDIFTKPLPRNTFENLRHKLGVIHIPHKNHKIFIRGKGTRGQGEHHHRGSEESSLLSLLSKEEEIEKQ
jgi:hypothetical protein